MNKKFIWILCIVIIIALIVSLNYTYIYFRIYPFDRITGTYSLSANGEKLSTIDEYYEYENNGIIRLENNTESFKIKGGKYGRYKIGFILDTDEIYKLTNDEMFLYNEDIDLSVVYFKTNWYSITNINIKIDMVKENKEWYVYYNIGYADATESNDEIVQSVSRKIKLNEVNDTEITIGI